MPGAAGANDQPPSSGELDDADGWQSVRDAIVETIEAEGWTDVAGGALLRMFEACEDGDDEAMAQLLADHPDLDVNAPGPDGDRALNLACLYGHLDCAKLLLDGGANASLVNEEDGSTALHDAAAGGYLEICNLVLDRAPSLVTVGETKWQCNAGAERLRARACMHACIYTSMGMKIPFISAHSCARVHTCMVDACTLLHPWPNA
eukprot:364630-Chlamydomonas_euryale.AAC.11